MLTAGYGRSHIFEVILANTLLSAERRVLLGANISPAFTKNFLQKQKKVFSISLKVFQVAVK